MDHPHPRPPASHAEFAWRSLTASSIACAVIAVALLLWYGIWVLLLAFAGILLGVLLYAAADALHRYTRLPRGPALAVATVVLFGALAGLLYFSASTLVEQASQLVEQLPQSFNQLAGRLESNPVGKQVVAVVRSTTPRDVELFSRLGTYVTGAFGGAVYTLIVVALGIFFAAQPKLYVHGAVGLLPKRARERACEVVHQVGLTLRAWIVGQLLDMVVIGSLTWLGLWMLGVPLAFLLGLLAALFNFVPNFGPLVSYVPAVLLSLSADPMKAVYVTALYVVLQNVEGYVLLPLIQRKAVDVPPALLIVSQVLLTVLAGAIGLMLSAPLTAAAVVAVKMLYVHDVRGEAVELPEGAEGPKPSAPGAGQ